MDRPPRLNTEEVVKMNSIVPRKERLKKSGIGLTLVTIIPFVVLLLVHILVTRRFGLPLLVGDRSEAMFDLWPFQHFCSGVLIGSLFVYTGVASRITWQRFILFILLLSLSWEATELSMECGWFGSAVAHWKRGFEHWGNRFIGDPLMAIVGSLLARKFKTAWKFVSIPALAWLIANVVASDSMLIQRLVFGP